MSTDCFVQYELVMLGHSLSVNTSDSEFKTQDHGCFFFFFFIKVEFKKHLTKNIQKEYVQMIFTLVKCKSKYAATFFVVSL